MSAYFHNSDIATPNFVLKPKLANFDVPNLASASPASNGNCSAGVPIQHYVTTDRYIIYDVGVLGADAARKAPLN